MNSSGRFARRMHAGRSTSSPPLSPHCEEAIVRAFVHSRSLSSRRFFHEFLQTQSRCEDRCQRLGTTLKRNCPKLFDVTHAQPEFVTTSDPAQFLRIVATARTVCVAGG